MASVLKVRSSSRVEVMLEFFELANVAMTLLAELIKIAPKFCDSE